MSFQLIEGMHWSKWSLKEELTFTFAIRQSEMLVPGVLSELTVVTDKDGTAALPVSELQDSPGSLHVELIY